MRPRPISNNRNADTAGKTHVYLLRICHNNQERTAAGGMRKVYYTLHTVQPSVVQAGCDSKSHGRHRKRLSRDTGLPRRPGYTTADWQLMHPLWVRRMRSRKAVCNPATYINGPAGILPVGGVADCPRAPARMPAANPAPHATCVQHPTLTSSQHSPTPSRQQARRNSAAVRFTRPSSHTLASCSMHRVPYFLHYLSCNPIPNTHLPATRPARPHLHPPPSPLPLTAPWLRGRPRLAPP